VLFERAAVVGVGLIGGSLALAARAAGLVGDVVGVGRGEANLETALRRGIVDRVTRDPAAIGPVDLVVVAVPVRSTAAVVRGLLPHLRPGTLITDVGSVKESVVQEVEAVLPEDRPFVGAHPIAGNELAGAAAADATLFRGARCVLTPTARTAPPALERIEALWRGVGAVVERMSPADHDRALAWTSHLVHVLAFALAGAVGGADGGLFHLAGPSLRDVTRVAASAPELWLDIFFANARAVDDAIRSFAVELERFRAAIQAGDEQALLRLLRAARAARARLEAPAS
jgi:prephenate dehydrogenase